jgi:hypothetical protein
VTDPIGVYTFRMREVCAVGVGASYTPRSTVFMPEPITNSGPNAITHHRLNQGISMTCCSFDASTKIHLYVHPSDLRLVRFARPVRAPLGFLRRLRTLPLLAAHTSDGDGIEHYPGSVLRTTPFMRPRVALIEVSVSRRVSRGLAIWREQGLEIRPMPAGDLSVPSCSEPGRIYRVSLAGEGCCSCPDWRHRRQPCKHVFAALIWAAKQRRALVLAEQRRAA